MTEFDTTQVLLQSALEAEIKRADALHPPIASAHEGWAVLLEEIQELDEEVQSARSMHDLIFQDIRRDVPAGEGTECIYWAALRAAREAIQVAAVAARFFEMEDRAAGARNS